MTFDLYGRDPVIKNDKVTKGAYFNNNNWWWRPLWHYIKTLSLLNEEQFEKGMYNDGYKITPEHALKIGTRLKHEVSQGKTSEYEIKYKEGQKSSDDKWASSYPFETSNVEEFAQFCIESGGFEIC